MNVELLTRQLELADRLLEGRPRMLEPQDLPGSYGRVVRAIAIATGCGPAFKPPAPPPEPGPVAKFDPGRTHGEHQPARNRKRR